MWFAMIAIFVTIYIVAQPTPVVIQWNTDWAAALSEATTTRQPVLMEFFEPDWPPILQMQREVFSRAEVAEALKGWILARVRGDQYITTAESYGVKQWPTYIALTPDGKELGRTAGAMPAEAFLAFVREMRNKASAASQPG